MAAKLKPSRRSCGIRRTYCSRPAIPVSLWRGCRFALGASGATNNASVIEFGSGLNKFNGFFIKKSSQFQNAAQSFRSRFGSRANSRRRNIPPRTESKKSATAPTQANGKPAKASPPHSGAFATEYPVSSASGAFAGQTFGADARIPGIRQGARLRRQPAAKAKKGGGGRRGQRSFWRRNITGTSTDFSTPLKPCVPMTTKSEPVDFTESAKIFTTLPPGVSSI